MKPYLTVLQGCLALAALAGCSEDASVTSAASTASTASTCGSATDAAQGVQPDKASIENLFGCVTFSHTSSNGENTFEDFVEFTAASEGEPILGGRTVNGMSGRSEVQCAELTIGDDDFLCVVAGAFADDLYVFVMDSQFKGSGTHQLCLKTSSEISSPGCLTSNEVIAGGEPTFSDAKITIARGATLVNQSSALNGLAISESEAHDYKMADMNQFGGIKSVGEVNNIPDYQNVLLELKARMHSDLQSVSVE